jgi:Leu/Phe-tRNA-protein transferase
MTINTAFDTVIQHCQQQHGGGGGTSLSQHRHENTTSSCWLYPTLLQLFRTIHTATIQHRDGYVIRGINEPNGPIPISIRLYSIEVWNHTTQEFAAGEIGYTIGNTIYTSLTGCCVEDSAGSVQMATLGALLIHLQSFYIWDLGMDMPYKQTLGAQLMTRQDFITLIHTLRSLPEHPPVTTETTTTTTTTTIPSSLKSRLSSIRWPIQQWREPLNCRDVIDAITTTSHNESPTTTATMTKYHTVGNTTDHHVNGATTTTTTTSAARPLNKKQRKELKKKAKMDISSNSIG